MILTVQGNEGSNEVLHHMKEDLANDEKRTSKTKHSCSSHEVTSVLDQNDWPA